MGTPWYAGDKVQHESQRVVEVGSNPAFKPGVVFLNSRPDPADAVAMTPVEARALAALLLKHADRAEWRGT